jgi:hypothetical protein
MTFAADIIPAARAHDGVGAVIVDVASAQACAMADACSYRIRSDYSGYDLEVQAVLALRDLRELSDVLHGACGEHERSVMRLTFRQVDIIVQCVDAYIADRDVESYQDPAERERLRLLGELSRHLHPVIVQAAMPGPALAA